jgi:TonB-dependent receptor
VKRSLKLFEVPFSIQAGTLYKKQDRDHRRVARVYTYNPPNPADPTPEPFLMQVYKNRPNYFSFDHVPWVSFNRMVDAWGKNPNLFTMTPAQQATAEQSRITNHETFRETTQAFYGQTEGRFFKNKLLVLTGVRYEKIHTKAAGPLFNPEAAFTRNAAGQRVRRPEAGAAGSIDEVRLTRTELGRAVNGSFDGYYPSLHLTYNVTPNLLARAAYARTYGKADFASTIPNTTIDENENFVSGNPTPGSFPGVLIVGNPDLKPWMADNFDLSTEYYTESGGVLSFGVYRKNITDFHVDITGVTATPAMIADLGLEPEYAGWELRTTVNGGDARVDGMEANFRQSLAPLGGWGRMFSVFANGTRLRLLGSPTGRSSFSRFIPRSANWGVTITRKPITLMLKWNHRGEQRQAVSAAQGPDAYLYQAKRTTTDINLTWQFHRHMSLFANGRNIFNVHYNLTRYGSETPGYAKVSSTNSYGAQWAFGVKGTF